jgi:hypothetical protein
VDCQKEQGPQRHDKGNGLDVVHALEHKLMADKTNPNASIYLTDKVNK